MIIKIGIIQHLFLAIKAGNESVHFIKYALSTDMALAMADKRVPVIDFSVTLVC